MLPCMCCVKNFGYALNTTAYHLGQLHCSSPSTKELHDWSIPMRSLSLSLNSLWSYPYVQCVTILLPAFFLSKITLYEMAKYSSPRFKFNSSENSSWEVLMWNIGRGSQSFCLLKTSKISFRFQSTVKRAKSERRTRRKCFCSSLVRVKRWRHPCQLKCWNLKFGLAT